MSRRWYYGLVAVIAWGLVGAGVAACRGKVARSSSESPSNAPEVLGETCVPGDEYATGFSGYDADEVSVGTGNVACGSDAVCLVNHFRGRVSCPYGQTQAAIETQPGDGEGRCVVPNTFGEGPQESVAVPVPPQLFERQAADAVYCSCRCADAEGNSVGDDLCTCPSGFTCEPLVADLGLGSALAGSYCVKEGTLWDQGAVSLASCNSSSENCGDRRPELDVPPPTSDGTTTNLFLERISQDAVERIDLLFMIDNSSGMADKQELLQESIPALLGLLLDPLCEDGDGRLVAKVGGACPAGTSEQFQPIADLHLGVVSSSLGGHGGDLCSPDPERPDQDERGELIAPLRAVSSHQDLGFLKWDPYSGSEPAGINDLDDFTASATELVTAVGEDGCGFEAGLEAWYRFLIDPQPPVDVVEEGGRSRLGQVNTTLLEQRSWFLRPDSLVAIVMLSDENDCSIRDEGLGWLVAEQTRRLPRGTEACSTDPNDPCCRSCELEEAEPPSGCGDVATDPQCSRGEYEASEDPPSLRCFAQKRRFGIDFLQPWERYVSALQQPTVLGRDCVADADCLAHIPAQPAGTCVELGGVRKCEYVNPLYAPNPNYPDSVPRADSSLVFLAGIVGVPWQDIATPESLAGSWTLEYLSSVMDPSTSGWDTLSERWSVILGDPDSNVPPADPFMVESIEPRDDLAPNPITGDTPSPTTADSRHSPINGHEYTTPQQDDLQYACIFPLDTPRDCASATGACDCRPTGTGSTNSPLCQAPGTADFGTVQYYAKAYPGLRYLKVLEEYGANSIVGSICPKISEFSQSAAPAFGYNPVVKALVDRIAGKLRGSCLPRSLPTHGDGSLACQVVEVTNPRFGVTCDTLGRAPVSEALARAVRSELESSGRCGNAAGQVACDDTTLCTLTPATNGDVCLNEPYESVANGPLAGYCYIDAMQDLDGDGVPGCSNAGDPDCLGNPELVAACDPSQRRILRVLSHGLDFPVPFDVAEVFVACESTRPY